MKILVYGHSDWNYYYDVSDDVVVSVVKKGVRRQGCNNWYFGTVAGFSEFLRREVGKKRVSKSSLTKLGHAVLKYGEEEPNVLADMFAQMRYTIRGGKVW